MFLKVLTFCATERRNKKKHFSTTHTDTHIHAYIRMQDIEQMEETFLSAGSHAEAELQNWALTILTLWSSICTFSGDRRKLNPIGSIAGTLLHSFFFFFFILAEIKALCQGSIVINLQVFAFLPLPPAGCGGGAKGHGGIEMSVMHARGGMNVCMRWDFLFFWHRKKCLLSWPTRACMTW